MPVSVKGASYDGVKEAVARLEISRSTLIRYIQKGDVPAPPRVKQGKTMVRYFPEDWYEKNEPLVAKLGPLPARL